MMFYDMIMSYICVMDYFIIFLICCTAVGFAVIKTVRFFFPKKEPAKAVENPYILHHRFKKLNKQWYDNYINWMQKNDPEGVPADRVEFKEDLIADKKLKGLY